MSKDTALRQKIEELIEATKDLDSFEAIEKACQGFKEWVEKAYSNPGTRGQELCRNGFYKKFRALPLHPHKNAILVEKVDETGKVVSTKLEHYVIYLCGISKEEWSERNSTTRVISRLGNDREIDPVRYLEVVGELLESKDPHELAVGLIAATGRRPHEILARAKFSLIDSDEYRVNFSGQGKKRGKIPTFEIPVLYPAKYLSKQLLTLRKEPSTAQLLIDIEQEFPGDIPAQNAAIDSRRNGSLNRVVRQFFGDVADEDPVLPFRFGEQSDNCKALRAAYGALATKRDSNRSLGSDMLYFARILGHIADKEATDESLQAVATSLGYADFYTQKEVPFCKAPEKEKVVAMRVSESCLESLKNYQQEWGKETHQEALKELMDRYEKRESVAKELAEAKAKISELESELLSKKQEVVMIDSQEIHQLNLQNEPESLESKIERMIEQKLGNLLKNLPSQSSETVETQLPAKSSVAKVKADHEFQDLDAAQLWASKVRGAAEEKIRRCYMAIASYNDYEAGEEKIAVTNQGLRELSGVNGMLVGDWLARHRDEVISHNFKHGLTKSSDRLDTYYNKRYGADKVSQILRKIDEQFLDGQAMKSRF